MKTKVYLGTEVKLNIHIEPMGNLSMDDYDFNVEFSCNPRKVVRIEKEELIRADSANYVALVDTTRIGIGEIKVKVTAYIPDEDFADGLRTEIVAFNSNIMVYNS